MKNRLAAQQRVTREHLNLIIHANSNLKELCGQNCEKIKQKEKEINLVNEVSIMKG